MPELPEVQTVVSDLNQKIKGDTIVGFWSDWPKTIKNSSLKKFAQEIIGRKILGARRIGKNIFIDLSVSPLRPGQGKKTLYLHLKMTGHLLIKNQESRIKNQEFFNDRVNQYIHHIFYLKKNRELEFSDMRKFAKIVLDDTDKINKLKEIKALGIDAMDPEFTAKKLREILAKRPNRKIRDILMDQNLIAGIGNIYLSEILFEAGILPVRLAKDIDPRETRKLHQSILKILKKAIKMRGTSDSDYRDTSGAPGGFQKVLKVYRRTGKKCPKCATMIQRLKMGQRSIFFCPVCQR